jgi:hypothetical protein
MKRLLFGSRRTKDTILRDVLDYKYIVKIVITKFNNCMGQIATSIAEQLQILKEKGFLFNCFTKNINIRN